VEEVMADPISSFSGGYVISKGAAALAGLFGGLSVSFFWQPQRLHQHGRLAAGAIIGGISVSASFALGGLIARWAGLNFSDVDVALGLGYAIGVMCVGVIAWVANFLEKRENDDIMEVVQEVRGNKTATPKKTVRKPAAAKKVAVTKKVEQK
jgi:hypothetical protein